LPDIYYPHCGNSASSLFRPRRNTSVFGGVFLWTHVKAVGGGKPLAVAATPHK